VPVGRVETPQVDTPPEQEHPVSAASRTAAAPGAGASTARPDDHDQFLVPGTSQPPRSSPAIAQPTAALPPPHQQDQRPHDQQPGPRRSESTARARVSGSNRTGTWQRASQIRAPNTVSNAYTSPAGQPGQVLSQGEATPRAALRDREIRTEYRSAARVRGPPPRGEVVRVMQVPHAVRKISAAWGKAGAPPPQPRREHQQRHEDPVSVQPSRRSVSRLGQPAWPAPAGPSSTGHRQHRPVAGPAGTAVQSVSASAAPPSPAGPSRTRRPPSARTHNRLQIPVMVASMVTPGFAELRRFSGLARLGLAKAV